MSDHNETRDGMSDDSKRDHWHTVWPEGEGHWCYKNGCVLDQSQNHTDDDAGVVVGGDRLDLDAVEARVKEAVDYDGYEGGRRAADVAREDAPRLIAEVRRLREELAAKS